jgi:hypothetical protein
MIARLFTRLYDFLATAEALDCELGALPEEEDVE